jgi:hypothetical protein
VTHYVLQVITESSLQMRTHVTGLSTSSARDASRVMCDASTGELLSGPGQRYQCFLLSNVTIVTIILGVGFWVGVTHRALVK